MTDGQARADALGPVPDSYDFRLVGKTAAEILKPAFGIDRRPQIAHVAGEDLVKSADHLAFSPLDAKALLSGIPNFVAHPRAQTIPKLFDALRKFDHHSYLWRFILPLHIA